MRPMVIFLNHTKEESLWLEPHRSFIDVVGMRAGWPRGGALAWLL
jgi:hypothetical protein